MKDPTHPAGPAFKEARNKEAALRAQRIAALTPEQRQEYERRVQDEARKSDELRRELEARKDKAVQVEKQKLLSGKIDLGLNVPKPMQELARQQRAEDHARAVVDQKNATEMERALVNGQARLDTYLEKAEGERRQHSQSNSAAQDPTLARAFARAGKAQEPWSPPPVSDPPPASSRSPRS